MKKLLVLFSAILIGTTAFADTVFIETGLNKDNFWEKTGKQEKIISNIGYRIIYANKLKQAPIEVEKTPRIVNAYSMTFNKKVYISSGIIPYINNDDEMAYVIAHELAHSMEAYGGFIKTMSISGNSKKYEYKADLRAIDYMVKAGYNPIAAIIVANKLFDEPLWDWGGSHPKASKRMMKMYEYIYTKYPQYLNSSMTSSINYQNFLNAQSDDIKKFHAELRKRQLKQQKEDI